MANPTELDTLKEQVREISSIASAVPEEFRQKCFELLMTHLLSGGKAPAPQALAGAMPGVVAVAAPPPTFPVPVATGSGYSGGPPMTAMLSAFVKKSGLSLEQFGRVVGYLHGSVVFFREPATSSAAEAQVAWSLLLALRNAIVKGSFLVDAEEVRLVCQEKGVFDRRGFYTNFRRCAAYYRASPEPGGKPQPLSSKGIAALGTLLEGLAGPT
jgi:hypothetical protein